MNAEPWNAGDYGERQVKAAHRVLVDLGQVLSPYQDCLVVIGGWVPQLLLQEADEPHTGSIDVDLALDAAKLNDGRYAELLECLLNTRRYEHGTKAFQLVTRVDLGDGGPIVEVEVEFLAPKGVKLKRRKHKRVEEFRVLQADGCEAAFNDPKPIDLSGQMVKGQDNTVRLQVASIADLLIMKAHAIGGRDKPKDVYDFCYCLQYFPEGIGVLAGQWTERHGQGVEKATAILKEKFATVDSYGPWQLVEFHADPDEDARQMHARRAYELVSTFLSKL